jgi:transcriptional regulator with XRE-family HTH domain
VEEWLPKRFGTLVRRLRLERAYVGMIERGEANVSVRTAFRLARALDLTLAGLFAELERGAGK